MQAYCNLKVDGIETLIVGTIGVQDKVEGLAANCRTLDLSLGMEFEILSFLYLSGSELARQANSAAMLSMVSC